MNSLNSVLLEGNLTRDPELKYTPKGTAVCSFSIASNRYFKAGDREPDDAERGNVKEEVSYFDIQTWAHLAEVCNEYLKKGRGVRVVGRLKQDRWTTADGEGRSKVFVVAEHVEFRPMRGPLNASAADERVAESRKDASNG